MLTLGNWQLERLAWKTEIIQELDRVYNSSNLPLYSYGNIQAAHEEGRDVLYGHIKGVPLWDKEILQGPQMKDRVMGFHVITPIRLKPNHYVLVNRGWISQDDTAHLKDKKSKSSIMFSGLIRKPEWNKYTPENSPENEVWTKLDIDQIAQVKKLENVLPYIMQTEKVSKVTDNVQTLDAKWYPRNKHAQYATFWFSMAFIFVGFFIFYAYRSKRSSKLLT